MYSQWHGESSAVPAEPSFNSPLWQACRNGNMAAVQQLIAEGHDPHQLFRFNNISYNCLYAAASGGHKDIVKLLLRHNVCSWSPKFFYDTPLAKAAKEGHVDVVRLLFQSQGFLSVGALAKASIMSICYLLKPLFQKYNGAHKGMITELASWVVSYRQAMEKFLTDESSSFEDPVLGQVEVRMALTSYLGTHLLKTCSESCQQNEVAAQMSSAVQEVIDPRTGWSAAELAWRKKILKNNDAGQAECSQCQTPSLLVLYKRSLLNLQSLRILKRISLGFLFGINKANTSSARRYSLFNIGSDLVWVILSYLPKERDVCGALRVFQPGPLSAEHDLWQKFALLDKQDPNLCIDDYLGSESKQLDPNKDLSHEERSVMLRSIMGFTLSAKDEEIVREVNLRAQAIAEGKEAPLSASQLREQEQLRAMRASFLRNIWHNPNYIFFDDAEESDEDVSGGDQFAEGELLDENNATQSRSGSHCCTMS